MTYADLTRSLRIIFCFLLCMAAGAAAHAQGGHVDAARPLLATAHPRILLAPGQEQAISARIALDPIALQLHQTIVAEADHLLAAAPVERIKTGRRLLWVSREALRRIFFLSYSYRLTHDAKYAARAERELLAVAAFSDWNPSHFLDVSEMTMAMAIGYDWVYEGLPEASRGRIREAIITKGLDASLVPGQNGWLKASNNWNQVCNAGMVYGAMAVYDDQPVKARAIINRAIDALQLPMAEYRPDGAYPEGYGYWSYGTGFNVMLIAALENMFGTSFGLAEQPGFLKTAGYLQNMTGPSGLPFNYSDSGSQTDLHPAMFWFAQRNADPSLLWVERNELLRGMQRQVGNRLLPSLMLWLGDAKLSALVAPTNRVWSGGGKNPVALMRTSWTDPNAIFVGVKGGSPSNSHAHMDAGSFVMDADGVRWASDFGMQEYESLESKQVDLWNMKQNSQRWDVFRYNNLAHNTLSVNGGYQRVEGMAAISDVSDTPALLAASVDMDSLYKGTLTAARRRIAIEGQAAVTVRDEVAAGAAPATVRWTMLTTATVTIVSPHAAELRKNGKTLLLTIDAPAGAQLKTWPTDPQHAYDAPNPGSVLLGFEAPLEANAKAVLGVRLQPQRDAAAGR